MDAFLLSQIIAGAALIAALLTFQFKKQTHVLMAFATMSALYAIHFVVLGQFTAAAIVAVSVVRFIVSIFSKHRAFFYLFLAATALVGWFTYSQWFNLIAIAAGLLGVTATFQRDDKRMRSIMMSSNLTMALHDIIVFTPVGIVVDLTVFVSGIIGYYRYHIKGVIKDDGLSGEDRAIR